MELTPRRRHPSAIIALALAVALLVAVLAGVYLAASIGDTAKAIKVFDAPRTFCADARHQSFTADVAGVVKAPEAQRPAVAALRARFIRRTANGASTPAPMAARLRLLAASLEAPDLTAAAETARAVDGWASAHCPR